MFHHTLAWYRRIKPHVLMSVVSQDLISYEIEEVEPMKVKECTEGQGI